MSRTVDERIVEMQFNNKNFEKNVSTSMNTLDKLKQSLHLEDAVKSFDKVEQASKKLDFSGLSNAVETVKGRFSAMEIVAMTALMNITNSAINAGKRLVSSLTVAPISQGFAEYGLKMGSIQTIMASTGETLETVNGYLDELNHYADKTIYSFSDMTQNIGTFTNAGVKLDKAVSAIQGISNVAAISGANANQAAHAMYNFAQALSSGSVKLIDWKSIGVAKMDTVEFKQQLLDTALAMGTVVKEGDKYKTTTTNLQGKVSDLFNTTDNFNDSLNHQWMTTDVLVQTLSNYSTDIRDMSAEERKAYQEKLKGIGYTEEQIKKIEELGKKATDSAQDVKTWGQLVDTLQESVGSGWASTFELIFGDFEESKKLWSSIYKVVGGFIDRTSEARNEALKLWKTWGGRDDLLQGFKNLYKAFMTVIRPIKAALHAIFPPLVATKEIVNGIAKDVKYSKLAFTLKNISTGFANFTSKLKLSWKTMVKVRDTFKGVFAILDIGKQALSAIIGGIKSLFQTNLSSPIANLAKKILDLTSKAGLWLVKLDETIKKNRTFINAVQKAVDIINSGVKKISEIFSYVSRNVGPIFTNIIEKIKAVIKAFKDFASEHFKAPDFSEMEGVLGRLAKRFQPLLKIFSVIKAIFVKIGMLFMALFKGVAPTLKKIGAVILDTISKILDGIFNILNGEGYDALIKLLSAGSLLSMFNGFNDFIKWMSNLGHNIASFGGIATGIKETFQTIHDAISDFQNSLKVDMLKKIATSILILSVSLLVLSTIDANKLIDAIGAISVLFAELTAAMIAFDRAFNRVKKTSNTEGNNKFDPIGMITGMFSKGDSPLKEASSAMIKMSAAILILSVALKQISDIDSDRLKTALVGITVLIAEMTASSILLSRFGGKIKTGLLSMIGFAIAIRKLIKPLKEIATLSWDELIRGVTGLGIVMTELVGFLVILGAADKEFGKFKMTQGIGILILASALKVFSKVVISLGSIDTENLTKGVVALGVILGELAAFSAVISKSKRLMSAGISFLIISTSMMIFAKVIKKIGSLSTDSLIKGLVGVAGALISVAIATRLMPKNLVAIGTGLILVSASLTIMAGVLTKLGGLTIDQVAIGLIALGGALLILAFALNKMKNTASAAASMLLFAGALLIMIPMLKLLGTMPIENAAKALLILAGVFVVLGVAALALKKLTQPIMMLSGAVSLLGVGLSQMVSALMKLSFTDIINDFGGKIKDAGNAIKNAIISRKNGTVAKVIIQFVKDLIRGIIDVITESIEGIFKIVQKVITGITELVGKNAPQIVQAVMTLLNEVLSSLVTYAPTIVNLLVDLIIGILNALISRLPEIITVVANFIGALVKSIADVIKEIDPDTLYNALVGIGAIAAIIVSFNLIKSMIPGAMVGILGAAAVVAEIGALVAAFGAIAQIPGVEWLIKEGGNLLEAIGTAIGQFVGGIVGGVMKGISSQLPAIGSDLSAFMENAKGFIEGAKNLNPDMLAGINAFAGAILALTAANVLDSLTSWLTGGHSLVEFGKELSEFGPHFKKYADSVKGVGTEDVATSAAAAAALGEMYHKLPSNGGLAEKIFGTKSLKDFAIELQEFGPAMKKYAESVKGLDTEAVTASASAAQMLADMADKIPNTGGWLAQIVGDNTLSSFGAELEAFGPKIKQYGDDVSDLKPEAVEASARAATMLVDMADKIPNTGGLVSFFTGDNDLQKFGEQLLIFGPAMKAYGDSVADIDPDVVTASTSAAKSLVELSNFLPKTGGLISWMVGQSDLGAFGQMLQEFGGCFKQYSDSVKGINADQLAKTTESLTKLMVIAAKITELNLGSLPAFGEHLNALGERLVSFAPNMKAYIESVGSIKPSDISGAANVANALEYIGDKFPDANLLEAKIKGMNYSLSELGAELCAFAPYMRVYSQIIKNIDDSVATKTISIADALMALSNGIPNTGGIFDFFTGTKDYTGFGESLKSFGESFQKYYESVQDIDADKLSGITSQITVILDTLQPLQDIDLEKIPAFADHLKKVGESLVEFGPKLAEYADDISDVSMKKVKASANIVTILTNLANGLPTTGGLASKIFGETKSLSDFGAELEAFGPHFKNYADSVSGIEKMDTVEAATDIARTMGELADTLPNIGGVTSWFEGEKDFSKFGESLKSFGESFKSYYESVQYIATTKLHTVTVELLNLLDVAKGAVEINTNGLYGFASNIKSFGEAGINLFIEAFEKSTDKVANAVNGMVSTANSNLESIQKPALVNIGKDFIRYLQDGIKQQIKYLRADIIELCNTVINQLKSGLAVASISKIGSDHITAPLGSGILSTKESVLSAARSLCSELIRVMQAIIIPAPTVMQTWPTYIIGSNAANGFVVGLRSKLSEVRAASEEMASLVPKTTSTVLDENSPSKIMEHHGVNTVLGFVNGIVRKSGLVTSATDSMVDSSITAMQQAIARISDILYGDLNTEPVIRPVLDDSELQNGIKSANRLMTSGINLAVPYRKANAAISVDHDEEIQNGNPQPTQNNYNFTQNNYSPKALSPKEIYRQTRNQFTAMKGMMAYG